MTMAVRAVVVSVASFLLVGGAARADEATELVKKFDAQMAPEAFEGVLEMIAHRDDGTTRHYKMRVLKSQDDKFRVYFEEPASTKGQEMLRVGDNMWVYMPNLKRAIRIASRDSFQGGDFNNADVMRVNYSADYVAVMTDETAEIAHLTLTARSPQVSYDKIELWLRRKDGLPVRAEYFASSGKKVRSSEFKDYRDYGGVQRPAYMLMRNELATERFSEMKTDVFDVKRSLPSSRFVLDDLGK